MATRKAVDYKGLESVPESVPIGLKGVAGSKVLEPRPQYIKADNEKVITDTNGSFIVMGRDRPSHRASGYGNEHNSARIDVVVGRVSADGPEAYNKNGEALFVDPSFESDAARIYISAKTDIDDNFKLKPGTVGNSKTRSAVGIKADAVRIIGREGIKLVTRGEPKNSQGGFVEYAKGIDLIAGNDDTHLQPLVKGGQLIRMLSDLIDWIGKLTGIVDGVVLQQIKLNTALSVHTHEGVVIGPIPKPVKTAPSIDLQLVAPNVISNMTFNGAISLKGMRVNLEMLRKNYLNQYSRGYINSRHNNTN